MAEIKPPSPPKQTECTDCGGSGDCCWCDGTGLKGGKVGGKDCPDCDGSGTCQTCGGIGHNVETDYTVPRYP